ncbi:MAG: thermonuclease family protein [Candidatus Accumulibacter sp.]|jgi:micrococcal nuclease|nr:thermonuclease family protein [Accumulibacter sp.]
MKKIFCLVCLPFVLAACTPLASVYERQPGKPFEKPSETPSASLPDRAPTGARTEPVYDGRGEVRDVFSDPEPDARNVVSGVVSEVTDGNRLTLRRSDGVELKVRLAGIDAPGLRQPYGLRARDYLVRICEKKSAEVVVESVDKNRQVVGRVHCYADPNKNPIDSTLEQLSRGVAWVARENAVDAQLKALEARARRGRRGLWIDPNPIPPWDWNKQR